MSCRGGWAEDFLTAHNRRPGGSFYDEMQRREQEARRKREEAEAREAEALRIEEEQKAAVAIQQRYVIPPTLFSIKKADPM